MSPVLSSESELDLESVYLAELADLEERLNVDAPERFNEWGKPIDPANWIWKLYLLDPVSQEPIEIQGKRGGRRPLEVWLFSSRKTYYDRDGRYTAAARKFMHALTGGVLSEARVKELLGESGLPFGLCGGRVLVALQWYMAANGRKRLSVHTLLDTSGTRWWSRGAKA